MHIRSFKYAVVGFLADQTVVLILPAFPCCAAIQQSVRLLKTSSRNLAQELRAQRSRIGHYDIEKSCKEEAIEFLSQPAFDVWVIFQADAVRDRRGNVQPFVCQNFRQHSASVGNAIQYIDMSSEVFYEVIAQPFGFILHRDKFRFGFRGIKTVIRHKNHMILLGDDPHRRLHTPIRYASAVEHHNQLLVFFSIL